MSIIKEYFYNIECDVCGDLADDEFWDLERVTHWMPIVPPSKKK